jgi:hypothetical protein
MAPKKTAKTSKAKKGNGAGKGQSAPRKKRAATPKPTAEALSDQERQRLLFHHKRKLVPLLVAEASAKALVTKAKELAKKEGVTWKELQLAIGMSTEEGVEKCGAELERIVRVARWMGKRLSEQLDLFPKQSKAEEAFADGKRAALNDEMRKPPSHLSQQASQSWMEGFDQGVVTQNEARMAGFAPLGTAAQKVAEKATGGAAAPAAEPAAAAAMADLATEGDAVEHQQAA